MPDTRRRLTLTVDRTLWVLLEDEAAMRNVSIEAMALAVLCQHYEPVILARWGQR